MTEIVAHPQSTLERVEIHARTVYRAGALAALVQLLCVLLMLAVWLTVGAEPVTAVETFALLQGDRLEGILRLDFASLVNVALFTVTCSAAAVALRDARRPHRTFSLALAVALVFVGVALALALHPGFSLIYLSDRHAAATTAAEQAALVAAGEAVIASGWWHSSGGFFAGIFLQGGTVLLMAAALRHRAFSHWTATAGILANGLDLLHVFVGLLWPGLAATLLAIGGIFYPLWYMLFGRDFLRLAGGDGGES